MTTKVLMPIKSLESIKSFNLAKELPIEIVSHIMSYCDMIHDISMFPIRLLLDIDNYYKIHLVRLYCLYVHVGEYRYLTKLSTDDGIGLVKELLSTKLINSGVYRSFEIFRPNETLIHLKFNELLYSDTSNLHKSFINTNEWRNDKQNIWNALHYRKLDPGCSKITCEKYFELCLYAPMNLDAWIYLYKHNLLSLIPDEIINFKDIKLHDAMHLIEPSYSEHIEYILRHKKYPVFPVKYLEEYNCKYVRETNGLDEMCIRNSNVDPSGRRNTKLCDTRHEARYVFLLNCNVDVYINVMKYVDTGIFDILVYNAFLFSNIRIIEKIYETFEIESINCAHNTFKMQRMAVSRSILSNKIWPYIAYLCPSLDNGIQLDDFIELDKSGKNRHIIESIIISSFDVTLKNLITDQLCTPMSEKFIIDVLEHKDMSSGSNEDKFVTATIAGDMEVMYELSMEVINLSSCDIIKIKKHADSYMIELAKTYLKKIIF
jgi:hypothetical protein